jgi:hypothetical protein
VFGLRYSWQVLSFGLLVVLLGLEMLHEDL